MDMNVLPSSTAEDGANLSKKMLELLEQDGYLCWEGRKVLSTFSGHEASFGGMGWEGWLEGLNRELKEKVSACFSRKVMWYTNFTPVGMLLAVILPPSGYPQIHPIH